MFKKKFTVVRSHPLRSSERKKLRDNVLAAYPDAAPHLDDLVPLKRSDVIVLELSNKASVWCINDDAGKAKKGEAVEKFGQPHFFTASLGGQDLIFPTVYSMWIAPDMMRSLFVHVQVTSFILSGADLMMPGVLGLKNGTFGGMKRDEARCVVPVENPVPFAVGTCCQSELEVRELGRKQGRAMKVLHYYRDELWSFGDRSLPNDGFLASAIEAHAVAPAPPPDEVPDGAAPPLPEADAIEAREDPDGMRNQPDGSELPGVDPLAAGLAELALDEQAFASDPDAAAQYALGVCFTEALAEADLPVPATRIYNELLAALLPDAYFSQTSQKNFEVFLRAMSKKGFCKCKEVGGALQLTQINTKKAKGLVQSRPGVAPAEVDGDGAPDGDRADSRDEFTPQEVDELLERTFLQAVRTALDPDRDIHDFPMESSAFYSTVLIPNQPDGLHLDVKQSSYKKLSPFLKSMAKKKYCTLKEVRGQTLVLGVNRQHPDVLAFKPYKTAPRAKPAAGSKDRSKGAPGMPVISSVLKPHQEQFKLFTACGADPRAEYTRKAASEVLERYVQGNRLIVHNEKDLRKRTIRVDDLLMRATRAPPKVASADANLEVGAPATFAEVQQRFVDRLEAYHVIEGPDGSRRVRKGDIPKIEVVVEDRQGGRKHVTRCHGVETFGLHADAVAQRCQVAFACAGSTQPMPGKAAATGAMEIHLQGNVAKEMVKLLTTDYGLPQKFVNVTDKRKKK